MPKFEKGNPGKPKGAKNKLTISVKETVMAAFEDLQEDPKANIVTWGKENPGEFYKIAAKLIPTELNANLEISKAELPPFMRANAKQS
jgi:hypothetical protein